MRNIAGFIFISLISLVGCNRSTVTPPLIFPEGIQEDALWPSLEGSPWAVVHGNPQLNGRSTSSGPVSGKLFWNTKIESIIPSNDNILSPVIRDSSLYIICYNDTGSSSSHLYSLSTLTGKIRWAFPLYDVKITAPPIVTSEGVIYTADWKNHIIAVNTEGKQIWKLTLNFSVYGVMNIGKDGTLYALTQDGTINAISKDGSVKWQTTLNNEKGYSSSAISITPDGQTLYISALRLTAMSTDGKVKWTYPEGTTSGMLTYLPIVDSQNNLYLAGGLIKLNSEGKQISVSDKINYTNGINAAIDRNGNIYMGQQSGEIVSVNHKGKLNWKKQFDIAAGTTITCDKNSNIYFFSGQTSSSLALNIITAEGILKQQIQLDGSVYFSPVIANRCLFICINGKNGRYIYCFKDPVD